MDLAQDPAAALGRRIDRWLKENRHVELVDLKVTVTSYWTGDSPVHLAVCLFLYRGVSHDDALDIEEDDL